MNRSNNFTRQLRGSSSATSSETSTLVDFVVDRNEEIDVIEQLKAHNKRWSFKKATKRFTKAMSLPANKLPAPSEEEMIDAEDRAWGPKPKGVGRMPFGTSSPRVQRHARKTTTGLEPEMIDEEDRAWM